MSLLAKRALNLMRNTPEAVMLSARRWAHTFIPRSTNKSTTAPKDATDITAAVLRLANVCHYTSRRASLAASCGPLSGGAVSSRGLRVH